MMTDVWLYPAALIAGLALGALFYAGLWATVARLQSAAHPVLLVAVSFLARTALALAGIWLASGGNPARIAFCLGGFLLGRWLVFRVTHSKPVD